MDILSVYILLGIVSSIWMAEQFMHKSYGGFSNWYNASDYMGKVGLLVIMFVNIFAWPVTIFIIASIWFNTK
jgi:hypothetical protein